MHFAIYLDRERFAPGVGIPRIVCSKELYKIIVMKCANFDPHFWGVESITNSFAMACRYQEHALLMEIGKVKRHILIAYPFYHG